MRKNTGKISAILLAGAWVIYFSCRGTASRQNTKPAQQIEDTVLAQVNTFRHFITDTFLPAVSDGKTGEKDLQGLFLKARLQLQRFEWAAEYFAGATTQLVNGPPVQEVENADLLDPTLTVGLDPSGLQVIEAFLYPRYDTARKAEVTRQLHQLVSDCDIYASYFGNQSLSDWRILDAAKLEIFRIITLGITGFDAPLALNSLQESAVSLESLRQVLTTYSGANGDSALTGAITGAIRYLRTHTDFNAFDRAEFITGYANKISAGMARLEKQLNQPPVRYNRLLRQGARTLFDSDAFNVNAFAPGPEYFLTAQKAALGKRLLPPAQQKLYGRIGKEQSHSRDGVSSQKYAHAHQCSAPVQSILRHAGTHPGRPGIRRHRQQNRNGGILDGGRKAPAKKSDLQKIIQSRISTEPEKYN
jgi:cytochrome c peroxidase